MVNYVGQSGLAAVVCKWTLVPLNYPSYHSKNCVSSYNTNNHCRNYGLHAAKEQINIWLWRRLLRRGARLALIVTGRGRARMCIATRVPWHYGRAGLRGRILSFLDGVVGLNNLGHHGEFGNGINFWVAICCRGIRLILCTQNLECPLRPDDLGVPIWPQTWDLQHQIPMFPWSSSLYRLVLKKGQILLSTGQA